MRSPDPVLQQVGNVQADVAWSLPNSLLRMYSALNRTYSLGSDRPWQRDSRARPDTRRTSKKNPSPEAKALAGGSTWLFPSPKGEGPVDPHAATKALERARPAIGLPDFRVHDLRRTAATRMAELGVNPHTVSVVLNHVSVRRGTVTGKVYDRYSYDREKREALATWGARLERILCADDEQTAYP